MLKQPYISRLPLQTCSRSRSSPAVEPLVRSLSPYSGNGPGRTRSIALYRLDQRPDVQTMHRHTRLGQWPAAGWATELCPVRQSVLHERCFQRAHELDERSRLQLSRAELLRLWQGVWRARPCCGQDHQGSERHADVQAPWKEADQEGRIHPEAGNENQASDQIGLWSGPLSSTQAVARLAVRAGRCCGASPGSSSRHGSAALLGSQARDSQGAVGRP